MLVGMTPKSLLVLAGAVGGTVLASAGVAVFLMDDNDGARPVASASAQQDAGTIGKTLRANGATGCTTEQDRVECRYSGRYVAATVITPDSGLTMDAVLEGWKSGVGQSALGEQGAFSLLRGPNWLLTGPRELVGKVRPELGGQALNCDRPFGTCS